MLDGTQNGAIPFPLKKQGATLDKRPLIWYNTLMSDKPTRIVVLNDGETFSTLDGCEIVTVSEDLDWNEINNADEIPSEFIISRETL